MLHAQTIVVYVSSVFEGETNPADILHNIKGTMSPVRLLSLACFDFR